MNKKTNLQIIHIRDLVLNCIIGINENEREKKQKVLINVAIHADLNKACASDKIEDSLNYRLLKKEIISFVEKSSFFLLEKLADQICRLCLKKDTVYKCEVTVDKPGVLRYARSVAVEVLRLKE